MAEWQQVGALFVDAGCLVIGDPSYLLRREGHRQAGLDYQAVIDAGNDPVVPIAQGMALLVQAFGGDGCYPVFVRFEGARLAEVRIEFVDADEAEGDRAPDEDGG